MSRPIITIAWSDTKGEATVSVSSAWKEMHWVARMDGLQDAIYELTEIYNASLGKSGEKPCSTVK